MRNLIFLIFSSGAGQFLLLASTPLLSRLYSPEAFGELGLIISISGILGILFSLRLEQSLLLAKGSKEPIGETKAMIKLATLLALVAAVVLALFQPSNLPLFLSAVAGGYIISLFSIIRFFLIMGRRYTRSGLMNVLRGTFQPAAQLSFYFAKSGLLIGWIVGFLPALYYGGVALILSKKKALGIYSLVNKNWRFLKFALPASLMSEAIVGFAVYTTYLLYGKYEAGLLAIIYRVLGFPVQLFARSISEYVSPIYRDRFQNGEFDSSRILFPLGIMLLVLIVLAFVFAATPISWYVYLLGEDWSEVKKYFLIMLPLFSIRSLSVCVSPIYIAAGKQLIYFIYMATILSVLVIFVFFAFLQGLGFHNYLSAFVALSTVLYACYSVNALVIFWRAQ